MTLHIARGATGGISVVLFFWGLAREPMAQSVALTFDNPSGQKQLAITLDPGTFGVLAAGAALVAFGLVLKEAVRLADENRSFV